MSEKSFAERITFNHDDQVMDVDFSDLTFDVSKPVNDFYDELDRKIIATGKKWYFLVNYRNCRIMTEAWISFAHRGKKANIAYSLGSARYAASAEEGRAILERSTVERFDPNLFQSREAALAHLHKMRAAMTPAEFMELATLQDAEPQRSYEDRILLDPDLEIMEADLSGVTFERSADVNAFYDALDRRLSGTGRKWYFLVNYGDCTIMPDAWITFASRGKRANLAHSLGSVCYDAGREVGSSIESDARRESFDPNLVSSRDEAIARIKDMRSRAAAS